MLDFMKKKNENNLNYLYETINSWVILHLLVFLKT